MELYVLFIIGNIYSKMPEVQRHDLFYHYLVTVGVAVSSRSVFRSVFRSEHIKEKKKEKVAQFKKK